MKERRIDKVTSNMLKHYADPVDTIVGYVSSMTEAIEKARFL